MGFLHKIAHPFSSPGHAIGAIFDPGGTLIRDATNRPTTPQTMLDPLGGKSRNSRPAGDPGIAPGLPGSVTNPLGTGGFGGTPALNQSPIQYPQLTQLPYFQPNPQGFAQYTGQGLPFIRDQAMLNTLGPLMQPNYGLPIVNPYASGASQAMPGAGQFPIMSGGLGSGGLQMPALGRWGVQPIRGAIA